MSNPSGSSTYVASWMREPLVHFLALGAVLFAVDRLLTEDVDDPRTITVDASAGQHTREIVEQEVLYREGIAMRLDKGDPAIRDRVIFKVRSMIEAGLKTPTFDEKTLRDWFARNHSKYEQPRTYDFQEITLPDNPSEQAVQALVADLNAAPPSRDTPPGLRVFADRPRDDLVRAYGEQFVVALEASAQHEWRALTGKTGIHVVRLDSVSPAVPANFEKVGALVLQDWIDATVAEQRSAAILAMEKRYVVKVIGQDAK